MYSVASIKLKNIIMILIAGIVNSIGIVMFLAPVSLYDGGFSGTAMLFSQIFSNIPLSIFLVLLNVPFFLYGYKRNGKVFTFYAIFGVCIYSISAYIITDVIKVDFLNGSPFAGRDLLLCAIFGGILSGAGSGITIRFGGALDGTEVMAVIFAKKLGLTVGNFVLIYNVLLYTIIGFVTGSFVLPLYSILTYCAAIKSLDFIVEGFDKTKSAMIVTTKEKEISKALSDTFGRGITHINATGYYTNKEQKIIYFVVNRFQIIKMKNIISNIDKDAFVTITDVSDILTKSNSQPS